MNLIPIAVVHQLIEEYEVQIEAMRANRVVPAGPPPEDGVVSPGAVHRQGR